MKHLYDYGDFGDAKYFSPSGVAPCFAQVLTNRDTDVLLSNIEYWAFIYAYDQVLPWNWDGKTFRGVNLHRDVQPHYSNNKDNGA